MRLELVTEPAEEPVSTADAKDHARITTSADDDLVDGLIVTARQAAEAYLGRSVLKQEWRMYLDAWPSDRSQEWWYGVREGAMSQFQSRALRLPWGPIEASGVTHIKTYDAADQPATLSSAYYQVDLPGARISLRESGTWPTPGRPLNGIEVQWFAGWTAEADVPESVKAGIKAHVATLYEHRGDAQSDLSVPAVSEVLYQRHRLVTL